MATRVALVGYGYWGPNLARNIALTDGLELAAVVERDLDRLVEAGRRHPAATLSKTLDLDAVDAIAVATPVASHYEIAAQALEAGKHVLVSKPLAATVFQAERLAAVAAARGVVLLVDQTFLYAPAARRIREIVADRDYFGEPMYADSVRVSLGLFRNDVDVLWDLAAHDLSLLVYWFGVPERVACRGSDPMDHGRASGAYLSCWWAEDSFSAGVHVNWLSPVKVRRILAAGSRRMVLWDDLEPTEKIRVYDCYAKLDREQAMVDYRTSDMVAPKLDFEEALAAECRDFRHAIETGAPPVSGPAAGVAVVRLLEAASRSLAADGEVMSP